MINKIHHKFHAVACESDGIKFPSKKERNYYESLKFAKLSGDLLFFLMQVPFHLPGNTKYRVDFVEFWKDGEVKFTEVKGVKTEVYKLKKRLVEEIYPIQINEI